MISLKQKYEKYDRIEVKNDHSESCIDFNFEY